LLRHFPEKDEGWIRDRVAAIERACREIDRHEVFELFDADPDRGYAAWAPTYDEVSERNPLIAVETPVVSRILEDLPSGRALDAACGTGRWAAFLADRGHDVLGVDASDEMLDVARIKVPAARFRVGQLTSLPVSDGWADLVVCALALTHVEDLGAAINELGRAVRPGGRLVLSDMHPFPVLLGAHAIVSGDGPQAFIRNLFHPHATYLDTFRDAGLGVLDCHEPEFTENEIAGSVPDELVGLAAEAIVGVPGALIWELERRLV
jgi:SAM-dependent methyltransferase